MSFAVPGFCARVLRASPVAGLALLALAVAPDRAHAACAALTELGATRLVPPPEVTPQGNPDHYAEWVYQEFPHHGFPSVNAVSSWAVRVSQRSIDNSDENRVLAVEEAIYTTTEGKRIHVLGGLWPVQIIVPYADSLDVAYDLWYDPPLVAMTQEIADLAPCGALGPAIYPRNPGAALYDGAAPGSLRAIYVKEVRDLGPMGARFDRHDAPPPTTTLMRRGSELVVWGVSDKDNYDNVVAYHFRDDGEIQALVGPTGWNTNVGGDARMQSGNNPHLHTTFWRVVPRIASDAPDRVLEVEYDQASHAHGNRNEHEIVTPLTDETALTIDAERFTALRFEDPQSTNEAAPGKAPEPNAYAMTLISDGTPRHRLWENESYAARFDYAVLIDRPEEAIAQPVSTEEQESVWQLVKDEEPIEGKDTAIYAFTTIVHLPRAEDFVVHPGAPDYVEQAPRNLTSLRWSGIRLTPRNVYTRVPFSAATPGVK